MVNTDLFRKALGNFATGVVVVSARFPDGKPTGVTISAFSSLSLSPPQILFCLRNHSSVMPAFAMDACFAINVLAATQEDVSNLFAQKMADPWEKAATKTGDDGLPLLEGCLAWLECRVSALLDGGDHVIVVGKVEKATVGHDDDPLLYFRSSYGTLREK